MRMVWKDGDNSRILGIENFKGEISLPIYPQMDEEQLNFIINVVKAAYITVAGTE